MQGFGFRFQGEESEVKGPNVGDCLQYVSRWGHLGILWIDYDYEEINGGVFATDFMKII